MSRPLYLDFPVGTLLAPLKVGLWDNGVESVVVTRVARRRLKFETRGTRCTAIVHNHGEWQTRRFVHNKAV